MKIGVVREIKDQENRVALTPEGVRALVQHGHRILIERNAGTGSNFGDQEYRAAGAELVGPERAWDSELVVKVKEPLPSEYRFLRQQMVFTFFHLAGADPRLTETLLARETTAIAYETLEDQTGKLPLLAPMSAIAGNMASLVGAYYLQVGHGGKGVQAGIVGGKRYGEVLVIGDGIVGGHAARVAAGMGANVRIAGLDPAKARISDSGFGRGVAYFLSTPENIADSVRHADLVIGAVLLHGDKAPHVMTRAMVESMQAGSVIVDVSIDQGGSVETSRPTTHSDPVFKEFGVIHYCVTNMPGAYPRTATEALTHATLPYIQGIADRGLDFLRGDPSLAKAVNTHGGYINCQPVAEALGLESHYKPVFERGSGDERPAKGNH
ncbi:MAG: alanine dehydrogenase [Methylococcaceae bacterium]|nr:alanine dehydrogenase [Methylococcaceae bacterium]